MTKAIQIKLLAAILAVLGVIAGLMVRGGRTVEATQQPATTSHEEQRLRQFVAPTKKHQLIP